MYAAIYREPLKFDVVASPAHGALCVSLHSAPDDDLLAALESRITNHVSYPWVSDQDEDAGRNALYQLGPPDPWMLALGALVWEGVLQGAAWDAVKLVARRALAQLRNINIAPPQLVPSATTSAWRNRLSVELGVSASKASADDELIGRLFIGLRVSLESDRDTSSTTAPQPEAPAVVPRKRRQNR